MGKGINRFLAKKHPKSVKRKKESGQETLILRQEAGFMFGKGTDFC
jgi:hypothetical protein